MRAFERLRWSALIGLVCACSAGADRDSRGVGVREAQGADVDAGVDTTTDLCGNGQVDEGEICDIAIPVPLEGCCAFPEFCVDQDPCTVDKVVNDGTCQADCDFSEEVAPSGEVQDQCCPTGASMAQDSDCPPDAAEWTFVDLGTLAEGTEARALAVNDNLEVAGWSTFNTELACTFPNGVRRPCRRAVLWSDGALTTIEPLQGHTESQAADLNNDTTVVGLSILNVPAQNIVRWFGFVSSSGSTARWLPGLRPNDPILEGAAFANAITNSGVIVGDSGVFDFGFEFPTSRAVVWEPPYEVAMELPTDGTFDVAKGVGANDAGQVVGIGFNVLTNNRAIASTGAARTLASLDVTVSAAHQRFASDRNNADLIVGETNFGTGPPQAALWRPEIEKGAWALPVPVTPEGRYEASSAQALNDAGEIVGYAVAPDGAFSAFYYSDQEATSQDLNDLLRQIDEEDDALDLGNVTIIEARDINEHGDIVGAAQVSDEIHAFLLRRGR